jgi:phosphatidylserine/phosphatidylglycerophosphate/cardiolipin synthase-like enzyme
MTLGALTELTVHSQRRLVISSPFIQQGSGIHRGPLAEAINCALRRGVRVEIVSTGKSLRGIANNAMTVQSLKKAILMCPTSNVRDDTVIGSHAKFCIADDVAAYIGSANLTGPGLNTHLEMGVLVKGILARQVSAFWDYMLQLGLFVRWFG